jgi:signal transduction histidine kinase/CheY-like chemotaxis protein
MERSRHNTRANVLIVDDDPLLRQATARLLTQAGHQVLEARNGEEGLALARKHEPDLILLDVVLPDIDGIQLCHDIKEEGLEDTYVVLISAQKTTSASQALALELGADGYIARPLPNRELVARVEAFVRIKQESTARRRSETRFRQVIDQHIDAILIVDPEGAILLANPATEGFLGVKPNDLVGTEFGQPLVSDGSTVELNLIHTGRIAEMRTIKIEWEEDTAYLISMRDITERKRIEQELKTYSEHLETMVEARTQELKRAQEVLIRKEKLALLGQIAGSIGHELRNPLGVITNAATYLQFVADEEDETVQEYVDIINHEVQRASEIISNLLDYARTRSANRIPTSLSALIDESLSICPPPDNVKVIQAVPDAMPSLMVDPQHVKQVLNNLITNAYQAMPEGGALALRASVEEDTEYAIIEVEDEGTGIPEEHMDDIFQPLFTTKKWGIGLGLVTSKNLVEANEGTLEVRSQVGEGTTFTLTLPVYRPPSPSTA